MPENRTSELTWLQADVDWMRESDRADWLQLLALLTRTRGPIARTELAMLKDESLSNELCNCG